MSANTLPGRILMNQADSLRAEAAHTLARANELADKVEQLAKGVMGLVDQADELEAAAKKLEGVA